nr:ARM repeat superfamily protein [Tanacetum cinerariifolium]
MVAYLSKSDASEGFNQIINLLNGSSIKYALTVNPNIYVSCIKQFWTTVADKKVNDITRLQALVDKKKVVVTEATIREALRLNDAEGVECMPNEEIFAELARMGYEKPSTKLTFYKAFLSSHWKFLIHTILHCMSANRTSWNEFSSSMASAIICLSSGDLSTHTTKYTSPVLTLKVFANMRWIGKGFSRDETPLFEGMLVEQQVAEGDADAVQGEDEVPVGDVTTTEGAAAGNHKLAEMDQDADVVLEEAKEVADDAKADQDTKDESEPTKVQEVVDVVTTTKLITEVVTAASEIITAASTNITATEAQVPAVTLTAAPLKVTVIDHVNKKAKEDNAIKRYQAMKRKPQTEAQAKKNMMIYLRNVDGFKMNYFKGMSYDDIRPVFEKYFDSNVAFLIKSKEQMDEEDIRALKRLNETPAEKAAKKQKLDKEVEELKRHLQIVSNEDDDMLNNVHIEVEEESEVSLELLSFGVDAAMDLKKNMLRITQKGSFSLKISINDGKDLKECVTMPATELQNIAASDALSRVLKDVNEHPMVRHEAAEALGFIAGITQKGSFSLKISINDGKDLKECVTMPATELQNIAASDALSRVLKDVNEHPMVRHEAAEALGFIAAKDWHQFKETPNLFWFQDEKKRKIFKFLHWFWTSGG